MVDKQNSALKLFTLDVKISTKNKERSKSLKVIRRMFLKCIRLFIPFMISCCWRFIFKICSEDLISKTAKTGRILSGKIYVFARGLSFTLRFWACFLVHRIIVLTRYAGVSKRTNINETFWKVCWQNTSYYFINF